MTPREDAVVVEGGTVRGVWYATIDGKGGWFDPSFVLSDDERIAKLRHLSDEATPGPWMRRWESLDVQYMGGADGLTAMRDIDFAVAACAFVRDMLQEIDERTDRAANEGRNVRPDATDDEAAEIEQRAAEYAAAVANESGERGLLR